MPNKGSSLRLRAESCSLIADVKPAGQIVRDLFEQAKAVRRRELA